MAVFEVMAELKTAELLRTLPAFIAIRAGNALTGNRRQEIDKEGGRERGGEGRRQTDRGRDRGVGVGGNREKRERDRQTDGQSQTDRQRGEIGRERETDTDIFN